MFLGVSMRRIVIRRQSDVKNFDQVEAEKLKKGLAHLIDAETLRVAATKLDHKKVTKIRIYNPGKEVIDVIDASDILDAIETCWDRDEEGVHTLTRWEEDFLDSIHARVEVGKSMTEKQLTILQRISEAEDREYGR